MDKFMCLDIKSFLLDRELAEKMQALVPAVASESLSVSAETMGRVIMDHSEIEGTSTTLGLDLMSDIEMFDSYKSSDTSGSVFASINQTQTYGGSEYLKRLLAAPISDVPTLECRSQSVKAFVDKLQELEPHLVKLKISEPAVSWIFNSDKEELSNLYDMVYFTTWFTRPLNTHDKVLTSYNLYRILASPAIGILSPLCYVIIPFYILRKQMSVKISFWNYVKYMIKMLFASDAVFLPSGLSSLKYLSFAFSLIFYFQGMFNAVELARAVNRICKLITEKVNGFIQFVQASAALHDAIGSLTAPFFKSASGVLDVLDSINTFKGVVTRPYSLFTNFGKQLSVFKRVDISKYRPLINQAYVIDAIASVAKLVRLHDFTYVQFTTTPGTDRPCAQFKHMWHPCLDRNKIVTNSLCLGQESSNNVILTGPNAGGKSTLIKSLLINAVFSQTCSVTCSKSALLRPFNLINSQINIPDCKGRESLFEAEMYRSKNNLDALAALDPTHCALIVMDEIFNSTNPVEGIAGAYAIAKHMVAHPNASCIITTHYLYLTKLTKDLPGAFTNYKMNVSVDATTGAITFPYKLSRGVSRQYIALELLRKNGFDTALIDDAIGIKTRLTTSKNVTADSKQQEQQVQQPDTQTA